MPGCLDIMTTVMMSSKNNSLEELRRKIKPALAPANINPDTFLATDYLNHFNEAVMLLELVPSDISMLEDLSAWAPRSYSEHFRLSNFTARELACQAYEAAPDQYRLPFDLTVRTATSRIRRTSTNIRQLADDGASPAKLEFEITNATAAIRHLISIAGAIVNGQLISLRMATAKVEDVLEDIPESANTMNQDDVDKLFD